MADEENPYSPPRAQVADAPAPQGDKPSVGARFLWASGVCFAIFVVLILIVAPRSLWLLAAFGSAMFALLSGLIAMCIPVKSKAGFIIPAVVISLLISYMIGRSSDDDPLAEPTAVEAE